LYYERYIQKYTLNRFVDSSTVPTLSENCNKTLACQDFKLYNISQRSTVLYHRPGKLKLSTTNMVTATEAITAMTIIRRIINVLFFIQVPNRNVWWVLMRFVLLYTCCIYMYIYKCILLITDSCCICSVIN
jgi:hypothetical protein